MITMMISAIENDFQREFITEIYKKYYSAMLKKALSVLDNNDDAEELVQNVFADLIERVETVMAVERRKLPAYLMSAVKYCAYNCNKRQSRWHYVDFESGDVELIEDEAAIPEEIYLKKEVVAELKSALKKIPKKDKDLLEFKYILGLSDAEIGAKFGITESAVRSAIVRARRKAYSVMKEGFAK